MQSNVQSNIHVIVDDISIALKKHLQNLFGDLLTKCDEYDVTNEIILSLPIVKKMLNAGSVHKSPTTTTAATSTMDNNAEDDCVFIKKEKLDPTEQTCTFNYDSLIGFVPPKIDDEEEEENKPCATESAQLKEDTAAPISLSLLPRSHVEDEDWSVTDVDENEDEDDNADNCDKCNEKIFFDNDASYVLTKDEEEVCWCQRCFEVGWNKMYKDGWECHAYDHLEKDDPEVAEPVAQTHNTEVNLSLNIEEVEEEAEDEDEAVDLEAVEEDLEEDGEEALEADGEDLEEDGEEALEADGEDLEEALEPEAEEEAEEALEEAVTEEEAEEALEEAVTEEEAEEALEEAVTEEEEEEAVTEEEEEAVTEDEDEEEEEEEEEDEEVFEVEIMGKNYYTNNISTGDIYEIDSAGDPGEQVGHYVHGIATFTR
jgi:hypothetical protein